TAATLMMRYTEGFFMLSPVLSPLCPGRRREPTPMAGDPFVGVRSGGVRSERTMYGPVRSRARRRDGYTRRRAPTRVFPDPLPCYDGRLGPSVRAYAAECVTRPSRRRRAIKRPCSASSRVILEQFGAGASRGARQRADESCEANVCPRSIERQENGR